MHFLLARPGQARQPGTKILSTGDAPMLTASVDNLIAGHWLGQVIPKRHARRSVTRNMLRRQVRAAMEQHVSRLRPGLWLVRLRQPFAKTTFLSADSNLLRHAVSAELDRLFDRVAE